MLFTSSFYQFHRYIPNSVGILNGLFSVPCSTGQYKSSGMTTCQVCDEGKEPNEDKTACGKKF